jgi:hypothetical protein
VVILLTIWISRKRTGVDKPQLWIKSISVIASCLVLCAGGAIINVLGINIHGDNNTVSIITSGAFNANNPDSKLVEDEPVPNYDTVDAFLVGWSDSNGGRDC